MQINCPTCSELVEQHRAPKRGDSGAGDAWVCLRCPAIICVACYTLHTQKAHPEYYGQKKQPLGDSKKNSKHKKR